MSRYDRRYDFGLRGYRQTTRPMRGGAYGSRGYDLAYDLGSDERAFDRQRLNNRVTARYNMDYVVGYRDHEPRNFSMYTGDRMERMGDERYYRRPYTTIGGTRTMRGSSTPIGYDYPVYGPNYGGRYPDEL